MLPGLLRQADPQHVIEFSLALITVLNEVGATPLPILATPICPQPPCLQPRGQGPAGLHFLWNLGTPLWCLKRIRLLLRCRLVGRPLTVSG